MTSVITRRDISLALVLIGIFPVLLWTVRPGQMALYATFGVTTLFYVWMFLKRPPQGAASPLLLFSFLVWVATSAIGLLNVFVLENDFPKFLIYSAMYFSFVVSLAVGEAMGRAARADPPFAFRIVILIGIIAFAESLLMIPRLAVIGVDTRSGVGYSFLFPVLLYLVGARSKEGVLAIVGLISLVALFVSIALLSGQRSLAGATLTLLIYFFVFMGFTRALVSRVVLGVLAVLALVLIVDTLEVDDPLVFAAQKRIAFVERRLNQTLLSETGFKLDENSSRGREAEAKNALSAFFGPSYSVLDLLVGRGFGFVFPGIGPRGGMVAHVHITPVGYFVRSGVLGLVFFVYVGWVVAKLAVRSHLSPVGDVTRLLVVICFVWFVSGLVSGLLNNPTFWFLLGFLRVVAPLRRYERPGYRLERPISEYAGERSGKGEASAR